MTRRLIGTEVGRNCNIFLELGKRQAMCGLCQRAIAKGQKRLTVRVYFETPYRFSNGGIMKDSTRHYHPYCFFDFFDIQRDGPECFDCHEGIPGRIVNFASIARNGLHVPLCSECARSRRWQFCHNCTTFVHIHKASQILDHGVVTDKYLCDHCYECTDIMTVKARKRLRRTNEG